MGLHYFYSVVVQGMDIAFCMVVFPIDCFVSGGRYGQYIHV